MVGSVVVGASLTAMGSWLDGKPYTVERVALNSALAMALFAFSLALPLVWRRFRR